MIRDGEAAFSLMATGYVCGVWLIVLLNLIVFVNRWDLFLFSMTAIKAP